MGHRNMKESKGSGGMGNGEVVCLRRSLDTSCAGCQPIREIRKATARLKPRKACSRCSLAHVLICRMQPANQHYINKVPRSLPHFDPFQILPTTTFHHSSSFSSIFNKFLRDFTIISITPIHHITINMPPKSAPKAKAAAASADHASYQGKIVCPSPPQRRVSILFVPS